MKRIIIASVVAMTVVAAALAAGATAGASGPGAVITFGPTSVTLQIPDPPCPTTEPNCVWKFFLNEPKVSVDVSTVYGTSGTLTLSYPSDFCGIIQADAYIGPTANGPWTPQRGWQQNLMTIEPACQTPSPPGSIPPGSTLPPDGSSQGVAAPVAAPITTTTTTTTATAPVPQTQAASVTPTTVPTVAKETPTVTTLPFTGINIMPFVLSGVGCVALGLGLLFGRRKRTS